MNEKQANQKGYHFQGGYSHDKNEMKLRAVELRNAGNKAIVVDSPPSKYSRGHHGMGYSIFWIESEENRANRYEADRLRKTEALLNEWQKLSVRIDEIKKELSNLERLKGKYIGTKKAIEVESQNCEECGEPMADHDDGECPRKINEDDPRMDIDGLEATEGTAGYTDSKSQVSA